MIAMHSPQKEQAAVSGSTHAGPLDGVRVLDLTSVVLGPVATQILADYGADVIKIEGPGGDLMRANGVSKHAGMSSIYLTLNRNKRAMMLDLKLPQDKEILRQLILDADAIVHNMRLSAIERLGFGYDAVAKINPRIVYCVATGFGQDGPHRDKPAFDDIIQAACGLVALDTGDAQAPHLFPSLIADKTTGLALANAVLAALLYRERHGVGQCVEVPMLETMASFVMTEHMGGLCFDPAPTAAGYARLLKGGRRPLRTRDGWICALPYTGRHWRSFFTLTGREDLAERYKVDDRAQRNANIQQLYQYLTDVMPQRSTTEWMRSLDDLDIPATPIYTLDQLPEHPHLRAVGLFQETLHPTEGKLREMRPAAIFSATPLSIRRHAPSLGEHTDEILREAGIVRGHDGP